MGLIQAYKAAGGRQLHDIKAGQHSRRAVQLLIQKGRQRGDQCLGSLKVPAGMFCLQLLDLLVKLPDVILRDTVGVICAVDTAVGNAENIPHVPQHIGKLIVHTGSLIPVGPQILLNFCQLL